MLTGLLIPFIAEKITSSIVRRTFKQNNIDMLKKERRRRNSLQRRVSYSKDSLVVNQTLVFK
jgi:hypothetical protein